MLKTAWSRPTEYSKEQIVATSNRRPGAAGHPAQRPRGASSASGARARLGHRRQGLRAEGPVEDPARGRRQEGRRVPDARRRPATTAACEPMAPLLASKFGYKVASMTYPGHLYLHDPSRDWPGDTINPDGTVRTPTAGPSGGMITPDQYELVQERSDPVAAPDSGARCSSRGPRRAREFYDRMAAWPRRLRGGDDRRSAAATSRPASSRSTPTATRPAARSSTCCSSGSRTWSG